MDQPAFIVQAWKTIARALAEAGVAADLDLKPATLLKCTRRQCMARLRQLAIMIRRLIFLMALSIEPAPLVSRPKGNYFETEKAPPKRCLSFRITPDVSGVFPGSVRAYSGHHPGPVPAAPVIAKWSALLLALKHCERRAARLARTLQRWRTEDVAKPYVPPMRHTHRLPREPGLLAGALTLQLTLALTGWPDTG